MTFNEFDNDSDQRDRTLKYLYIKAESDKAWLVIWQTRNRVGKPPLEVSDWMPKSQCSIESVTDRTMFVPGWLVEKKGLQEYEQ